MISDQNETGLYGPLNEWFGLGFVWSHSGIAGLLTTIPTIDIELDSTINRTPDLISTINRGPNLTSDLS